MHKRVQNVGRGEFAGIPRKFKGRIAGCPQQSVHRRVHQILRGFSVTGYGAAIEAAGASPNH